MTNPQEQEFVVVPFGLTAAWLFAWKQIRARRWNLAWRTLREELGLVAGQVRNREWHSLRRYHGWVAEPANLGPGTAYLVAGYGLTRRRAIAALERKRINRTVDDVLGGEE